LRGPVETAQYTSSDYTQTLTDHTVLGSIGTVGDAYDNALAESFVDSYKTELIADRVWRTRAQLELATARWVAWFNHDRLHESLGDIPPVEFEQHHDATQAPGGGPNSRNRSVALVPSSKPADGLTTHRIEAAGVKIAGDWPTPTEIAPAAQTDSAQAAPTAPPDPNPGVWPLRREVQRNMHTDRQTTPPTTATKTY